MEHDQKNGQNEALRQVPSVDRLLKTAPLKNAIAQHPKWAVVQEARSVLEDVRAGKFPFPDPSNRDAWIDALGAEAGQRVSRAVEYRLKRVVNATGVVLHTNLGRALLSKKAIDHIADIAMHFSNLELDLATGERGSRYDLVEALVCELTGAEAAIVVNNNAAAVILTLSALAVGKEVVISRGELVEIGGSFRVPEIMRQSGAVLVEVGTTNRTHLKDYAAAITPLTGMLLKVHTSNFRIVGFTAEVPVRDLAALGKEKNLPVVHDLGAGCLVDLAAYGLPHEPTVKEALDAGADIVTFSGDKLLGGPQMGVIAGKKELIKRLKKHQLLRALRVDKLTLAAFEATLRIYRDSRDPVAEIPSLRMLTMPADEIRTRADAFANRLQPSIGANAEVKTVAGHSQVGAGSMPAADYPTWLVSITPKKTRIESIEEQLRRGRPPIMVRMYGGDLLLDLRTIFSDEEPLLEQALVAAIQS